MHQVDKGALVDALFFACLPPTAVSDQILRMAENLRRNHNLRGEPPPPERFHATLAALDLAQLFTRGFAATIGAAISSVRLPAFDVTFDYVMSFRGGEFVLGGSGEGVAGLRDLSELITASLRAAGLRGKRSSTPHVTLLRDHKLIPKSAIEPISWPVEEFVLIASSKDTHGLRRHDVLHKWPLDHKGSGVTSYTVN